MKKNYHIFLTEEELTTLRDTCPNDLMNLIIKHEWMKGLYTNDLEQNARLMIVRFFFNKKKPLAKCVQLVDKVGQTKLLRNTTKRKSLNQKP